MVNPEDRKREVELQKQFEQKRMERAEKAPKKKLSDVLPDPDEILYVYVDFFGAKLPYKPLSIGNLEAFGNIKSMTDIQTAKKILYEIFHAADESVTMELINRIPFDAATEIINECVTNTSFLERGLGKSSSALG